MVEMMMFMAIKVLISGLIAIMTYSALSYFISTLQRTVIQSLSVSFICLSV